MAKRRIVYIDALSFSQWWYFLFFVIGIIVRKYFDTFVRLTDNQYVIAVLLAVFSLTFLCRNEIAHVSYGINVLILGFSGTILSFTFSGSNNLYSPMKFFVDGSFNRLEREHWTSI